MHEYSVVADKEDGAERPEAKNGCCRALVLGSVISAIASWILQFPRTDL